MRGKSYDMEQLIEAINKQNEYGLEKLTELIKGGKDDYFLGIREGYMNIYYKGMNMAKIEHRQRGYAVITSYYYAQSIKNNSSENNSSGYITLQPSEFFNNIDSIKSRIKDHVLGSHPDACGHCGLRLEKLCQQWIINKNNSDPKSDWYYVDMEYVYKGESENKAHPFGRADLIAINRKAINGKHDVAFVELKVGSGAYGGSISKDRKKADKTPEDYTKWFGGNSDKTMEILFDKKRKNDSFGLGSGLVGHIVDYIRFFSEDLYKKQVKEEIVNIIKQHKDFGVLEENDPLVKIEVNDLADSPLVYVVSYTGVPGLEDKDIGKGAIEKYKNDYRDKTIQELKEQFQKYFFNSEKSSKYALENLLDIAGKNKNVFNAEEKNNNPFWKNNIQDISYKLGAEKGKETEFHFRFVDATDKDSWQCLPQK